MQYRTLVVDDEEQICTFIGALLERQGHDVVVHGDPREGLEAACAENFDALVCDFHMPDADGARITAAARGKNAHTAVLMVSGDATSEMALRAFASGADGFIAKPFGIQEFTRVLGRVLAKRALYRETDRTARDLEPLEARLAAACNRLRARLAGPGAEVPATDLLRRRRLEPFMEQCLGALAGRCRFRQAVLLAPDEERAVLHPVAALGQSGLIALAQPRAVTPPGDEGLAEWIREADAATDVAAIPLRADGRVCGVLQFEGPFDPPPPGVLDDLGEVTDSAMGIARRQGEWISCAHESINAFESLDPYLPKHSRRVADLSEALASTVRVTEEASGSMRLGGVLHDFGRIGLVESVVNKKGLLDPDETRHVQSHAEAGSQALDRLGFLADILPMVRGHHERWDGAGYPDRLAGDAIPAISRISALSDAVVAMNSVRPHRGAMRLDQVRREVDRNRGVQFDPEYTEALMEIAGDFVQ